MAETVGNADDLEDADMLGDDTEDVADGATGMGIQSLDEGYLRDDAPEDEEEDEEARPVDALIGAAMYRDATGASAEREIGTGGVYGEGDADDGDEENFTDENEYTARRFSEAVGE